jgi:hypothetical protein
MRGGQPGGAANGHGPGTGPTPAGIYDYMLGGPHHTDADRDAAEQALAAAPEARAGIVANRTFLQRAIRFAARNGIRQFIDLGSGYPNAGSVHEVAAEHVAGPRVLYVDYDPAVVALSRQVIAAPEVTAAAYDIRDPERIIASPELARLIDWSQPVAVVMVAVLHFVTDEEDPARIVAAFRDRMAPGSYLVLSHVCFGGNPGGAQRGAGSWSRATSGVTVRTREEITSLFTGLQLLSPGLVPVQQWGTSSPAPRRDEAMILGGVARAPGSPAG